MISDFSYLMEFFRNTFITIKFHLINWFYPIQKYILIKFIFILNAKTPLCLAIEQKYNEIVKLFLEDKGSDNGDDNEVFFHFKLS